MVLDTILTTETPFSDIDKRTCYDSSLYTWTVAGSMVLSKKLKNIRVISSDFDYEKFSKEGAVYLNNIWLPERFADQKDHASKDFTKEKQIVDDFLKNGKYEKVSWGNDTINNLLKENILIAQVDYNKLYNKQGAGSSHYILIYRKEGCDFEFHDPGLPGYLGQKVDENTFIKAFSSELIAIPRPEWLRGQELTRTGRNDQCPCGSGKKFKKCHGA